MPQRRTDRVTAEKWGVQVWMPGDEPIIVGPFMQERLAEEYAGQIEEADRDVETRIITLYPSSGGVTRALNALHGR